MTAPQPHSRPNSALYGALINPLTDESRWTVLNSRFELNWDAYEWLGEMIDKQMEERPVDDPVRLMWYALPKAQRPK